MMGKSQHLTKSKYLSGLHCSRKLWFDVHDHEPFIDAAPGSAMDIGKRVGRGAHTLFPDGIEIDAPPWEHAVAVEQTKNLMADAETLAVFEGAFEHNNIRIRADVLERLGPDAWGLREVKSSLSVKEESRHHDDVAIQLYVLRGCGVDVQSSELIHVNREYIRGDDGINWQELLCRADLTAEAEKLLPKIENTLAGLKTILTRKEAPDVYPSKQLCRRPYECDYWLRCTSEKPDDWIAYLPSIRQDQIEQLLAEGIETIRDIPEDFPLRDTHKLVKQVMQTGKPYVSEDLGNAICNLGPPAYYLDFETVSPIIPLYPRTRPIERIPFQWSIHHLGAGGELSHYEYLADGSHDPRRELTENLLDILGREETPILAYYASFERSVIEELSELFPDLALELHALTSRLADPLTIVRSHTYYPGYRGSFSLKTVAPTLAPELDYEKLDGVADGREASAAYWYIASGEIKDSDKKSLQRELLDYCRLDTEALMKVHLELRNLAELRD